MSKVALFVNPTAAQVRVVLDARAARLLQFHGRETPEFCRAFGRPYLKAVHVKDGVDLLEYASLYDDAAGLLFDALLAGRSARRHRPGVRLVAALAGGAGASFRRR